MTIDSSKYTDRIETWLRNDLKFGSAVERLSSTRVRVALSTGTKAASQYRVYFDCDGDDIVFESLVFKSVSGDPAKVRMFYEALLVFNGAVVGPPIAFSLVNTASKKWRVSLKGSQECKRFDKDYLGRVLDQFHEAYLTYVPEIKSLAEENGLFERDDDIGFLDLWTKHNFPNDE